MRIATVDLKTFELERDFGANSKLAVIEGQKVSFSSSAQWPESPQAVIEQGLDLSDLIKKLDIHCDLSQVKLQSPIPRPNKNIYCVGFNYQSHIGEVRSADFDKLPEHPVVFSKAPSCVCGPYDDIADPYPISKKFDWEVELACIIGQHAHLVPAEKALDYVFGYTVINDLSARDLQQRHQQFLLGKSLPGAAPMGPWLVTKDEISDPQSLSMRSFVNGELMQDASTSDQIFNVAKLIATISAIVPLEPGDVIATGTPAGVGAGRSPPTFLTKGDEVSCEIDAIGCIKNRII